MNKRTLISFVFCLSSFTTQSASAAEPPRANDVCVRNFYPEGSNMNPCSGERTMFRKVISAEDEAKSICTKAYEDRLCEVSPKEYRYVETAEHEVICTVNFHQEGIAEYCYSNPKVFSWARGR
jgi:ribosomal protein L25 (general stress protein Ctc)